MTDQIPTEESADQPEQMFNMPSYQNIIDLMNGVNSHLVGKSEGDFDGHLHIQHTYHRMAAYALSDTEQCAGDIAICLATIAKCDVPFPPVCRQQLLDNMSGYLRALIPDAAEAEEYAQHFEDARKSAEEHMAMVKSMVAMIEATLVDAGFDPVR